MILEKVTDTSVVASRTQWTCPMHPQIVRDEPGSCQVCGMALGSRVSSLAAEDNTELRDMNRRFWVSLGLPDARCESRM
jgi:P-type Cu+ transporter